MFSSVLAFVKNLVATRGAQLAARYIGVGLTALAVHTGVEFDVAGLSSGLGLLLAGLAGFGIDLLSHNKQAEVKAEVK